MQAVSSRWWPAITATTLTIVTTGTVYPPLGTSGNATTPLGTFRVTKGQLTIDSGNMIRRTLSQTQMVPTPDAPTSPQIPSTPGDTLFPDGAELELQQGIVYPTGQQELVQLGRLLLTDVEAYNYPGSGNRYLYLNAEDRASTIDRDQFTDPYSTNGVTTLDKALTAMFATVAGLTYNLQPGPAGFPVPAVSTFNVGTGRFAAAQKMCSAVGYEVFPDAQGIIVLRPIIDPSTIAPSATYTTDAQGILVEIQRSLINKTVPNLIIMQSQGSHVTPPLRSVWWDDNPASPTFYNSSAPPLAAGAAIPSKQGKYPTTTKVLTNSTAVTQAANDVAAESAWLALKGTFKTVDFRIRFNPAQDVEDVVVLTSPGDRIFAERYSITSIVAQMGHTMPPELKGRFVVPAGAP